MTGADPHLVALLGLPGMGPRRLTSLLQAYETPSCAWTAVAGRRVDPARVRIGGAVGRRASVLDAWAATASATDVAAVTARHVELGIDITVPGDEDWPEAFRHDPEPPPAMFSRGDRALLRRPAVAVVGTRRCTAGGASIARELGHDLARAGVGVVSGLALGIDGAAHRGSLDGGGPAIGVVATGLDVVYPRRHAHLWEQVATEGLLLSEFPLGTRGERWRFPARNRLIAALASAVVVVESQRSGGSMLTVDSAIERQTEVLAVPGSVRAPASAGPNQLIVDGCGVVRDAADVLVAIGVGACRPPTSLDGGEPGPDGDDDEPSDPVACAIGSLPSSLDQIVTVTGLSFTTVAARLAELELAGLVERVADGVRRTDRF